MTPDEGRTTHLHPAVVIAAVSVPGAAFGFPGTFLAVPASVVAKVLVEELWFRRLEETANTLDDPPHRVRAGSAPSRRSHQ